MTPHERRLQSYDTKIEKATKEGDTDEVQRLQAGKQNYLASHARRESARKLREQNKHRETSGTPLKRPLRVRAAASYRLVPRLLVKIRYSLRIPAANRHNKPS